MTHIRRRHLVRLLLVVALMCALLAPASPAAAGGYDRRTLIINTAIAQLGKPYLWGASGPNAFDCSGLTYYCYNAAGTTLSRMTAADYYFRCDRVAIDKLEPGDMCFRTNLPDHSQVPTNTAQVSHVGIYVGGGQVIHAPGAGKAVCYTAVSNFYFFGRLKETYWPPDSDRSYDQPPLLTGDFNGDRKADVAFVQRSTGSTISAQVALSQGTAAPPALQQWYIAGRWGWDRTKVVAGDFNGDGKTDIAALYDSGNDTVNLWMWLSTGSGFKAKLAWSSAPGAMSWQRAKLVAGDFDGDKRCDVGIFYDAAPLTSQFLVALSTGTSFSAPQLWWTADQWDARRSKVAAGDFTGDGRADLAIFYDYGNSNSKIWVAKSTGSALVLQPVWFVSEPNAWDWNRAKMVAADVNGDRRADLMMLYDDTHVTCSLWWFPSTGSGFQPRIRFWSSTAGGWEWEKSKLAAGDVDGDGRAETLVTYDYGGSKTSTWMFDALSGGAYGGQYRFWSGTLGWNFIR